MSAPEVFAASVAQAEVVGRLLFDFNSEFEAPGPGPDILRDRFVQLLGRADVLVLLAGSGQDPDGFVFLTFRPTPYHDGPLAQVEELYVRPRRRGKEIGTALLRAAVRDVAERRGGEIHINVDEVDTDARRFYERHGFTNVEPGADYRMLCYIREM